MQTRGERIEFLSDEPEALLGRILAALAEANLPVLESGVRAPDLENAFLEILRG